jgi:uncharacterized coiled-coil protein SlyX
MNGENSKESAMSSDVHRDLKELSAKVQHTENEVAGINSSMKALAEGFAEFKTMMFNQPKPEAPKPTWTMQTVLAAIGMVAGGLYVIVVMIDGAKHETQERIDMQLGFITEKMAEHRDAARDKGIVDAAVMLDLFQFQRKTHYEFGRQIEINRFTEMGVSEAKE